MIETPVKKSVRSGPPAGPPPDPRTRMMDPPPAADLRYAHACADCGLPIHEDQAACLSCGAMIEHPDGGAGVRRAALGSVTALLVLGGAVGAAVAGLPHGKRVPKAATAQVFGGQKELPEATAGSNGGGSALEPVTPLPGADTGKAPPPIAPVKPTKAKRPKANRKPASGNPGSSSASTGGSNGSSKGRSNNNNNNGGNNGGGTPKPKPLTLFTAGQAPTEAGLFGSSAASGGTSTNTIDSDVSTRWLSPGAGKGVWVTSDGSPHNEIGVVSKTGGYTATLYSTKSSTPPTSLSDWTQQSSVTNADKKQRLKVQQNKDATYFLVLVGASGVSINEIQLLP